MARWPPSTASRERRPSASSMPQAESSRPALSTCMSIPSWPGLAAGLEYQPGGLAHVDELIALCRVVAWAGGVYAPHQRGYWSRLERGSGESFRVGRESGVKVHISHLAVDDTAASLLEEAQAEGI